MDKVQASVTSRDGTRIAFERSGTGPAVILVGSALADRSDTTRLAARLADHFTVINYDRRGRGASTDIPPYAVEREVEDLATLIEEAGGSAFVFGSSSGAVLALKAAASNLHITKLALYEPPFVVDDSGSGPPNDLGADVVRLLAADRRSEAVRLFMTKGIGVPTAIVTLMRLMPPVWSKLTAVAHTIPYDLAIVGDHQDGKPPRADQWAGARAPTLVIDGGKSAAWQRNAVQALTDVLPEAQRRTLAGHGHSAPVTAPKKLAPLLIDFFRS